MVSSLLAMVSNLLAMALQLPSKTSFGLFPGYNELFRWNCGLSERILLVPAVENWGSEGVHVASDPEVLNFTYVSVGPISLVLLGLLPQVACPNS